MLSYEAVSSLFLGFINAVLYAFWFAALVFVLFIMYMTCISIKLNQSKDKKQTKKSIYKKYYQSIMYSIPLLIVLFVSFASIIF